jgi:hypothetical protein
MKSPTGMLLLLTSLSLANAFVARSATSVSFIGTSHTSSSTTAVYDNARPDFEFSFEIPKKGIADVGTAEVRLPPLLEKSEIIVVRYDLPFGLKRVGRSIRSSGVPRWKRR